MTSKNIEIPNTLEECLKQLMKQNKKEDLAKWSKTSEDNATSSIHFTTGMNLRNNWKLWDKTSPLSKYFKTIGIVHADDMSGIILTSLYRTLNGKDIDLESQVKYYRDYWTKMGVNPDTMEETEDYNPNRNFVIIKKRK